MYEFEILLENGSTDNISGYSYEDALFRSRRKPEEVVKVLNREYFPPKMGGISFPIQNILFSRPRMSAAAGIFCQEAICTIFGSVYW